MSNTKNCPRPGCNQIITSGAFCCGDDWKDLTPGIRKRIQAKRHIPQALFEARKRAFEAWSMRDIGWDPDQATPRQVRDFRRSRIKENEMKTATYNGYCVKCKEKRDFEGEVNTTKTGGLMAKGPCRVCNTTICRILPKPKA